MRSTGALGCAALLIVAPAYAQDAPPDSEPAAAAESDAAPSKELPADEAPASESASDASAQSAAPTTSAQTSDPPAARPSGPSSDSRVYEPPPPGATVDEPVYEPPPPPQPHHLSPKTSLWVGVRVGWFLPFGNAWARATPRDTYYVLEGVPWSDYASSGAVIEGDVGMRLGRSYNLFFGWERSQLGGGTAETAIHGEQTGGDSDFWGLGLRANSDPDRIGFVSEVMIGYRRFRARWKDGTQLQLTDAPFEARLGLGAEFRLNRALTLSPLLTLGAGAFGKARYVDTNGNTADALGPLDEGAGHGWLTLQLGGHFDLAGAP